MGIIESKINKSVLKLLFIWEYSTCTIHIHVHILVA